MQRWSIGQSRSMHGAHSGGLRTTSASAENGRVVSGFVGPKMTTTGQPTAAATCAGPVSFVTSRSHAPRSAAVCARFVLPVSIEGRLRARRATSSEMSSSSRAPTSMTCVPARSASMSASAAKRSTGQRFARLFVEPGQSATSGRDSSAPDARSSSTASRLASSLTASDASGSRDSISDVPRSRRSSSATTFR